MIQDITEFFANIEWSSSNIMTLLTIIWIICGTISTIIIYRIKPEHESGCFSAFLSYAFGPISLIPLIFQQLKARKIRKQRQAEHEAHKAMRKAERQRRREERERRRAEREQQ